MTIDDDAMASAARICGDVWDEMSGGIFVRLAKGLPLVALPEISLSEAKRKARLGENLLARIAGLDEASLTHDVRLNLRVARFRATWWSRQADWYWLLCDPGDKGFYGMFCPTAYCGGYVLNAVNRAFAAFRFERPGDGDRYVGLLKDYGRLVGQMAARTQEQARRGIVMPVPQIQRARALIPALARTAADVLTLSDFRAAGEGPLAARIIETIDEAVLPAFAGWSGILDEGYEAGAPSDVGLQQYPDGRDVYCELARMHVTLDLTPEQLHAIGLQRMAGIAAEKTKVRESLGWTGSEAAFETELGDNPRFRAASAEGVERLFNTYIDRFERIADGYFSTRPLAKYRVGPLPSALEPSMTFGYYQVPTSANADGVFLFNSSNLTRQSLVRVASLTYHELAPGHHFHFCMQNESNSLHPIRQFGSVNAFNEGWAEYAATLADEIGLYDPYERYGRLLMDAFLTSRLVVDTGLNALGWTLEEAQTYLRANTDLTSVEIASETIRYSSDMPAQALAYKLGDSWMLELREHMRETLGTSFDIRDFHAEVMTVGALPLPDLKFHIEYETARLARRMKGASAAPN